MACDPSRGRVCQGKYRSHRMNLTVRWVSRWNPPMMSGILRPSFSHQGDAPGQFFFAPLFCKASVTRSTSIQKQQLATQPALALTGWKLHFRTAGRNASPSL